LTVCLSEPVGVAHHPAGDLADARWCRADDTDALSATRRTVFCSCCPISEASSAGPPRTRPPTRCCVSGTSLSPARRLAAIALPEEETGALARLLTRRRVPVRIT
jgi:hypothetical protein